MRRTWFGMGTDKEVQLNRSRLKKFDQRNHDIPEYMTSGGGMGQALELLSYDH